MGTKNLNGMVHQRLLHNQHFPPVSKVGKCQPDSQVLDSVTGKITVLSTGRANLILGIPSQMEIDACSAFADESFQAHVLRLMH